MPYSYVVLDAMGVLYRDGDDVTNLLVPYLRSKGCDRPVGVIEAVYRECSLGIISTGELWKRLGVTASDDEYCRMHLLAPGTIPALTKLREAGIGLACLTNDTAEWSLILRKRFGLDSHISRWFVSAVRGLRKPDPRLYRLVVDELGVAPAQILYVDDRRANIVAARQLGMDAVCFETMPELVTTALS